MSPEPQVNWRKLLSFAGQVNKPGPDWKNRVLRFDRKEKVDRRMQELTRILAGRKRWQHDADYDPYGSQKQERLEETAAKMRAKAKTAKRGARR